MQEHGESWSWEVLKVPNDLNIEKVFKSKFANRKNSEIGKFDKNIRIKSKYIKYMSLFQYSFTYKHL